MVFISFIIVFNVSIISFMIITFSSAAFTFWIKSLKLYQLPALNNPNYDDYLKKEMDTKKEKKLDIFQFFAAAHNFETWVYGFKRDGNKDLFEKLYWDNCKSDYRDPIYAINQYFINKFKTTIEDLRKCTNPDKYNETDYQESVILKDVHRALNSLSSSQKKKKFEALDKVLDDDEKCRTFYRCFHMTKSKYFNMLKNYTGYSERKRANNFSKECEDQLSKLTSVNWFFHYTEIFKHLKIILDKDKFAVMRSCRALFEENNYKFYVMRLVMFGCMPLARPEWDEEYKATNRVNSIAKQELEKLKELTKQDEEKKDT